MRRRSGDECAVVEMHSAYSRQTSNHRFFQIPVARAGAGERRDASAWSSRGAFAVLGSENMPRGSRETSARSRTRSTSPATRPIGAGPLSASGLAARLFSCATWCLFWVVGCPTAGRGFGEAPTSIGPFAPAAGSGPRLHRSCGVSHPRATPREARGVLDATAAPHTSCPQLGRPKTGRTRLARDTFFFSASANFQPRRLLTAAFLRASRQSTASWRRRARGRFPRF